ncbi:hypothetical protein CAOG_08655, partial [Capsaspora owczarzaki ATCC 30864]|uniref:hypothetical protein n=1 Tax=Capsaspora owczarzaki (strain ATCC 30864) TaxID=595528 RepID=UPI0003523DB4
MPSAKLAFGMLALGLLCATHLASAQDACTVCTCSSKKLYSCQSSLTQVPINIPANTIDIDLSGTAITSFTAASFFNLSSLTSISISGGQGLTSIASDAFQNLTQLRTMLLWLDGRVNLDSSNAPISTLQLYYSTPVVLSANTFTNFNSLTYLSLRDASSMEDHALAGLPSLFELVLTGSLTSVAAAVQGVSPLEDVSSSLQMLTIAESNVASISDVGFNSLTKLKQLVIQTSRITSISSNAFAALTSLTSLTLNSNPITSIHADAFAGITRLQA